MTEPTAFDAQLRFAPDGRVALVTGAAHGLGLASATALAGAGYRVALVDIDQDALAQAAAIVGERSEVLASQADARRDEAVEGAVNAAVERWGRLDVLVNCAAIYPTATLETMPSGTIADVLDVNVVGYARFARAATPALRAAGDGRIINFGSITFFLGFPPGLGAYIASKGAVLGLTRMLARELGPAGVTVNAIAPGAFPTRAEGIIEDREAYDREVLDRQCLKRRGSVSDIACAVLFLASPAASFITGQTLVVDGGWVFD